MKHGAVEIEIVAPTLDAEELDDAFRSLREALDEHESLRVEPRWSPAPEGSKGSGVLTSLLVSITSGSLPLAVSIGRDWLRRRKDDCKLVISLSDSVKAEIDSLDALEAVRDRLKASGFDWD